MIPVSEQDYIISHLPFYDTLSHKEKSLLLEHISKKTYQKGDVIYGGSTECLGVLLVSSGAIRCHLLSNEGKDVTLYRLFPGDICILSASCLLKNITFDVHITAESDSEVFLIQASVFEELMKQNIYVENFSYKLTIDKFSEVMWSMEQILFMSFDERLAIFLFDEYTKNKSLKLSLTHSDIATYIGSAREAVSRVLKEFQKDGIIEQSRGTLRVLDMKKLRGKI